MVFLFHMINLVWIRMGIEFSTRFSYAFCIYFKHSQFIT